MNVEAVLKCMTRPKGRAGFVVLRFQPTPPMLIAVYFVPRCPQSYRLVNGLLHYRSIREVGHFDLDEGWVVAVPAMVMVSSRVRI